MKDLFKEKAADWDLGDGKQELSKAIGQSIIKGIPFSKNMSVLDFGAGTGLICSHIAPLVNKIAAVDISMAMLNKLAEKPELKDKVEVLCLDIMTKPFEASFDVIVSAMALHHVENTAYLTQRFAGLLKSGGKIALADLDKEDGTFHQAGMEGVFHQGFDRKDLKNHLEQSGFGEIQFQTIMDIQKEQKNYPVFLVLATKL